MATDTHKRKDAPLWLLIIVGIAIAIAVPTGIACIVNHQMITGLVIMGCALATLIIVIAGFPTAKADADTAVNHDEESVANVRKTSSNNATSSHDENAVIKPRVRRTSTGAAVPNNHGFATSGVTARLAAKAAAEAAKTNAAASTTTHAATSTTASTVASVGASNSRTPQQQRQQHNTAKPQRPQRPQIVPVDPDTTIVSANNMTVSGRIPCTVTITTRSIIITPTNGANSTYEQMTLKRTTPILDIGSDKMLALAGPQTATTMLSHQDPRVIAVLRKAIETGEIKRPKKKTPQQAVPQQQPVVQSQRQPAKPNRTLTANQSTPRPANSPRRTTTISFH